MQVLWYNMIHHAKTLTQVLRQILADTDDPLHDAAEEMCTLMHTLHSASPIEEQKLIACAEKLARTTFALPGFALALNSIRSSIVQKTVN